MSPDWNTIISVLAALTPFTLAISAGIAWLYKHEKERREAVERQLSEKKYTAYTKLLDIYFETMKATMMGKKSDKLIEKKSIGQMTDASKDIILYGSDDVVKTYLEWLDLARKEKPILRQFGQIVVSIRRDMGNQKTKITSDDVLGCFIKDYEDAKAKGLI